MGGSVTLLKTAILISSIALSNSVGATILSLNSSFGADTITRDTSTGPDWLDVTETDGLSYNQVTALVGSGETYEGWRYASAAELDQLIVNFGYIAVQADCDYGVLRCDVNIGGGWVDTVNRGHAGNYGLDGVGSFSMQPSGPAAAWLLGTALLGLFSTIRFARKS